MEHLVVFGERELTHVTRSKN